MAQIILDSNNNLIQGDFDNATLNNRTKLQTTTTNATTNVYVVPNGSSTSAGVSVANNSSLTNASKIVMATNGTTDTQIISGVNGSGTYLPLSFYTNNALAGQFDTSGNFGVGTASPTSQLAVQTTAGSSTGFLKFTDVTYGGDVRFGKNTGISNDAILGTWVANNVRFFASGAEAMRIDSGGNVMIGTTSTSSKFLVTSSGDNIVSTVSGNSGANFISTRTSASGGSLFVLYITYNGTQVGSITNTSSATAYNTGSDYRLKENIVPMTGALDKVSQLKPVIFKWKVDGSAGQGFIAHELQEHFPDAVSGGKDAVDAEGKPIYQGVDTSFLVATLTKAIQEQQAIINELKTRIEALESK
jgi:hypothetical protein